MPPQISKTGALQRGSACLQCRKKKLKCDGGRPCCFQCIKLNRKDECEYDDARKKSRTQKLRDKLLLLENRVKELEASDTCSSPSTASSGSSPTGSRIAASTTTTTSSSSPSSNLTEPFSYDHPFQDNAISPSFTSHTSGATDISLSRQPTKRASNSPDDLQGLPLSASWTTVPFQIKHNLLTIFFVHRHQCWFDASLEQYLPYLSYTDFGSPLTPHLALMASIYLLGSFFSRSVVFKHCETLFYALALEQITMALGQSDRLVDVVKASCLLSNYLFANGRKLEAYSHSFAAARLAVGLGLHQTHTNDIINPSTPHADPHELQNNISTFWQVYMLDHYSSAAHGFPPALPDGDSVQARITTPWPGCDTTLEHMRHGTIRALLAESFAVSLEFPTSSIPELRAKASVLYNCAQRLNSDPSRDEAFWANHRSVNLALRQFVFGLPPFVGYEFWRNQAPYIDIDVLTIHTLVRASFIHLDGYNFNAETCEAADIILSMMTQTDDADHEFLDPIMGVCWVSVATMYNRVLEEGVDALTMLTFPANLPDVKRKLDMITAAMSKFGTLFPVAGEHIQKMNQRVQATFS